VEGGVDALELSTELSQTPQRQGRGRDQVEMADALTGDSDGKASF
jgi:hypothetical protein